MKQSPIFSKTYDLVKWLLPATVKFPRQQRFVLAAAIQTCALDFQDCLIAAGMGRNVPDTLLDADILLQRLRVQLRLAKDLQLLDLGQYAHVSRMVTEVGRLLGGWRNQYK